MVHPFLVARIKGIERGSRQGFWAGVSELGISSRCFGKAESFSAGKEAMIGEHKVVLYRYFQLLEILLLFSKLPFELI